MSPAICYKLTMRLIFVVCTQSWGWWFIMKGGDCFLPFLFWLFVNISISLCYLLREHWQTNCKNNTINVLNKLTMQLIFVVCTQSWGWWFIMKGGDCFLPFLFWLFVNISISPSETCDIFILLVKHFYI
jgi:hypothetical protein